MKAYTTDSLRNVVLVGHQGAGKTSLVEAMLYATGATTRMGKIEEGNTVADFDQDEKDRGLSIYTALVPVEYKDCKINVLDAPGYVDFQGETKNAVRAADAVVMLVDAVSGPEVGTELAFSYAQEFERPVIAIINKMDRENANFSRTLNSLSERFPHYRFVPIVLPIGSQADFKGAVDLLAGKALLADGKKAADIPADMTDEAEEARTALIEAAAEGDDALMERYFDQGTLADAEVVQGMRSGMLWGGSQQLVPVLVASSTHNIGTIPVLDALVSYTPSAAERPFTVLDGDEAEVLRGPHSNADPVLAYVFHSHTDKYGTLTYFRLFRGTLKNGDTLRNLETEQDERIGSLGTVRGSEQLALEVLHAGDIGVVAKLQNTYVGSTLAPKSWTRPIARPHFSMPIYAVSLHPRTQSDSAKMGEVLTSLSHSDPTLQWHFAPATKQTVLEGMGGTHIDVAIKRAERLGVGLDVAVPKVPYQETVTRSATSVYRHKKQTGGAGQFAEVHLRVEPLPQVDGVDAGDFEFVSEIVGGSISQQFVGSTEKGVRSVLDQGVVAGYPVKYVRAAVYDGKMHPVDSKDIAFQTAGRGAFKEAFADAGPVLLEPIMTVRITVPEENMGDIMGDMNTRRGRVLGMETEVGHSIVTAEVPLAEIQRYSNDLRSMTAGRGVYTMEFLRYERVPAQLQEVIIAQSQKAEEEEE